MLSKFPKWVEIGVLALSIIAGHVNAVGLLGFSHQSVSHLTGIATRLGFEFSQLKVFGVLHLVSILISFILGAMFSGFFIRSAVLKLGRQYGMALFIESILLFVAMVVLKQGSFIGHYFASAACGLQNAMVSTYSGAIIRTTHVTGVFTDLGIMMGEWFRGVSFDRRRFILYVLLILGFILGGFSGSVSYQYFGFNALLIPASMALFLSFIYFGFSNMRIFSKFV
ncbi:MAG: YoaK family protein [bacterium]|nr:YoaK family protein [bacterium]